jgi:hypothetical protein
MEPTYLFWLFLYPSDVLCIWIVFNNIKAEIWISEETLDLRSQIPMAAPTEFRNLETDGSFNVCFSLTSYTWSSQVYSFIDSPGHTHNR